MKSINKILLLIVISLFTISVVKAQETMYLYKDGAVVGEHELAEVDSVIFYKADVPEENTVTDIDGNVYETVEIGMQIWMAENLKTTTYKDGIEIQNITDGTTWSELTVGAYCWYDNEEVNYKEVYGALYNWYAVETTKLCPNGWHVPTDNEWQLLISYLSENGYNYDGTLESGNSKIGKSLASPTKWQWQSGMVYGAVGSSNHPEYINKSGFSGMPGGMRNLDFTSGNFSYLGQSGYWWSSSVTEEDFSYNFNLYYFDTDLKRESYKNTSGYSVRCIKD